MRKSSKTTSTKKLTSVKKVEPAKKAVVKKVEAKARVKKSVTKPMAKISKKVAKKSAPTKKSITQKIAKTAKSDKKAVAKKTETKKVTVKKVTPKVVATKAKKKVVAKSEPINVAILLAGGSGSRMRGTVKDKVLEPLLGLPIILHSFKAFLESGQIGEVIFVCRDDLQKKSIKAELKKHFPNVAKRFSIKFADGGAERQDSVHNGLSEVSDKSALAFIHDGARPLVGAENIVLLAAAAMRDGASVLAAKVSDTIKRAPANGSIENIKLEDMDRSRLWAMQTPQVFKASEILSAYKFVRKNKMKITDDVAAYATLGLKISIVENVFPNPKITLPQDIARVEFLKTRKA